MEKCSPIDALGKNLLVGDWVLVVAVPAHVSNMPDTSKRAFSNAVGKTFQIEAFNELGCLELDLWPKVSRDTIWVEPYCVERSRRYRKFSKALQKKLAIAAAPIPPRFELKFEIVLKSGVSCEGFGLQLMGYGSGGGFAVWPEQRRIQGSVYANKNEPDALEMLDRARNYALGSEDVESVNFEPVVAEF